MRWMSVGTREDFAEFYRRSKDECLFAVLVSAGDRLAARLDQGEVHWPPRMMVRPLISARLFQARMVRGVAIR